jgi:hypothetical protein
VIELGASSSMAASVRSWPEARRRSVSRL